MPKTPEIPKWDPALAALVRDEYMSQKRGLKLDDIKRLAKVHTIRFDDIMVTLFELVLNSQWQYEDDKGVVRIFRTADMDKLYVGGRLKEEDVSHFTGSWKPCQN